MVIALVNGELKQGDMIMKEVKRQFNKIVVKAEKAQGLCNYKQANILWQEAMSLAPTPEDADYCFDQSCDCSINK